jgi:hypothetical protein
MIRDLIAVGWICEFAVFVIDALLPIAHLVTQECDQRGQEGGAHQEWGRQC